MHQGTLQSFSTVFNSKRDETLLMNWVIYKNKETRKWYIIGTFTFWSSCELKLKKKRFQWRWNPLFVAIKVQRHNTVDLFHLVLQTAILTPSHMHKSQVRHSVIFPFIFSSGVSALSEQQCYLPSPVMKKLRWSSAQFHLVPSRLSLSGFWSTCGLLSEKHQSRRDGRGDLKLKVARVTPGLCDEETTAAIVVPLLKRIK